MSLEFDVSIGEYSLLNDFGIKILDYTISPPVAKTLEIPIRGTSDVIDLTESLTNDVEYNQRTISIIGDVQVTDSIGMYSDLLNKIHGQKFNIVFSYNPFFYWTGRISVSNNNRIHNFGNAITIVATVDPYKYEAYSSIEPWTWDELSFYEGIIRQYADLPVPSNLTIVGRRKKVQPIFHCSQDMTVTYLGNTYQLYQGENSLWDIRLGEGNHNLSFSGSGTVSVDYRGGSL